MKIILTLLMFAAVVRATPVTIEEALGQQSGVVITETQECCEHKKIPWWPLLFVGVVPLAFIGHSEKPPAIMAPFIPFPGGSPQPVPEPATIGLALLGLVGLIAVRREKRK